MNWRKGSLSLIVSALLAPLCGLGGSSLALATNNAHLTKEERAEAMKLLLDSQTRLLDMVENLTAEQWNYKPAPDRWSAGEVTEHILLAEERLLTVIDQILASEPNPDWEAKTSGKNDLVKQVALDRGTRFQAPEFIQPKGLTRTEILTRYKQARSRTIQLVKQNNAPLKAHTMDHPVPALNTLNGYQWLVFIPLHNLRHNEQIAEVLASPGFPRSAKTEKPEAEATTTSEAPIVVSPAALSLLFKTTHYALTVNAKGITHAESLIQPQPAGNCMNWVLGHVLASRHQILHLLGEEPIWSEAEVARYKRGSKPVTDGSTAISFEKMLSDLNRSQERIMNALSRMTDEELAAPTENGTVGKALAFLQFHEGYHAGQIGLLRRIAGKEGAIP